MEILTAYVRKNSSTEDQKVVEQNRVPVDIQAVLNVIGRRKGFFLYGEPKNLQLQLTNLRKAHLECIHLEEVNFHASDLQGAYLQEARLVHADLRAHLEYADLREAHLEYADIKEANLQGAKLKGTNLEGADLRGAKNITIDQLSKVKTLYNAKLDPELEKPLREKYPALFEKPDE